MVTTHVKKEFAPGDNKKVVLKIKHTSSTNYFRLKKGWTCKRKCEHVPIEKKNLLIIAGDDLLTAYCRTAINTR